MAYGHLIAASGLWIWFSLDRVAEENRSWNSNLEFTDPEFAAFPVSKNAQQPCGDIALVICRGFGGMNVALLVRANP